MRRRDPRQRLADVVTASVSERVAEAFARLDRAAFVPKGAEAIAYEDRPVPLPGGQTTSQPSLIAMMVDAAVASSEDNSLEIGTGYGFQTALLASLTKSVVSVERLPELAEAAAANLEAAGVTNVRVVIGDGHEGFAEAAPYDTIVVSAAASGIPPALVEQLAPGGRLVIPVVRRGGEEVVVVTKTGSGSSERSLTPARFVPLLRGPQ